MKFFNWLLKRSAVVEEQAIEAPLSFEVEPMRIPITFDLSLLVIADTHNCLCESDIPFFADCNACFLLGDLSGKDLAVVKRLILPYIPVYGVLGNHDDFPLYKNNGIEDIHGRVVSVNGVRVAGLQGSIRYKHTDYPLYTDEESVDISNSIETADILISHDSPKYAFGEHNLAHSGLQGVTDYCFNNSVPLNIHGHHHVNKHNVLENGTLSICCHKCILLNTAEL